MGNCQESIREQHRQDRVAANPTAQAKACQGCHCQRNVPSFQRLQQAINASEDQGYSCLIPVATPQPGPQGHWHSKKKTIESRENGQDVERNSRHPRDLRKNCLDELTLQQAKVLPRQSEQDFGWGLEVAARGFRTEQNMWYAVVKTPETVARGIQQVAQAYAIPWLLVLHIQKRTDHPVERQQASALLKPRRRHSASI